MDRRATSSRQNSSDRSRSPLRSSEKNYEKTLVSLEQAAVSKIEETNLFNQFPEIQTEVQIKENTTEISFCGPPYKKKQLIMEMFFELQKNNILILCWCARISVESFCYIFVLPLSELYNPQPK